MPYSKFTIAKLEKELSVKITRDDFFKNKKVNQTDWLKQALKLSQSLSLNSEKAKSEFLITPILIDIRNINKNSFDIFSGENLDVDIDRDLNGECDFILTKSQSALTIHSPIFGLVEAKKADITSNSIAQCIAQMIGAYIFNEQEENSIKTIFGCVTTGEIWQFMKLEYLNEKYIITIENRKYYIDNTDSILGVLQQVIDFYK